MHRRALEGCTRRIPDNPVLYSAPSQGLRGELILQAGMHDLECQFRFDALVDQLQAAHIQTMDPFTNFPFLKEAFTAGERWSVAEKRITRLFSQELIR